MIATHNRTQLLPPLLQHLTTDPPPSLRQILLVWQNVGSPLPDFLLPAQLALDYAVPIHVRVSDRNSMNERFRPELDWGNQLETRDVMIMDDDVVLRRGALEWGYQEFLRYNLPGSASSEGRIVGFTARDFRTGERGWEYVVQPQESYSLVLSNSAWLRREWLAAYWAQTEVMAELRDFVDEGQSVILTLMRSLTGRRSIQLRRHPHQLHRLQPHAQPAPPLATHETASHGALRRPLESRRSYSCD